MKEPNKALRAGLMGGIGGLVTAKKTGIYVGVIIAAEGGALASSAAQMPGSLVPPSILHPVQKKTLSLPSLRTTI